MTNLLFYQALTNGVFSILVLQDFLKVFIDAKEFIIMKSLGSVSPLLSMHHYLPTTLSSFLPCYQLMSAASSSTVYRNLWGIAHITKL